MGQTAVRQLSPEDTEQLEFTVDQTCTLFFDQNRVFRAINPLYEPMFREMLDSGMLSELIDRGLFVNTWVSDLSIKGYKLVLEHQYIENWNYPYEWTFQMLKDAGQVVLDCAKIAEKYGYEPFDVHAFNVVFDMGKPIYVDLGSFLKKDERDGRSWSGYNNFYNSFYIPLFLYRKGFVDLPANIHLYNGFYSDRDLFLLRHPNLSFLGIRLNDLLYKIHHNARRLGAARTDKLIERYGKHTKFSQIKKLKRLVGNRYSVSKAQSLLDSIKKSNADSYWRNYDNDKQHDKDKRFTRITEIISSLSDCNSIIELASNQGKFASHILQNTHIDKIIATDYDRNAVDTMYSRLRSKDLKLQPIVYDFVRPNKRENTRTFQDRMKSDIVMALAVTHHLVLTQDVDLKHIFEVMKSLGSKYVLVEFMPLGLYSGNMDSTPDIPDYYTLEWFRKHFTAIFDLVLDERLEENRHLFVGSIAEELDR